MTDPATMADKIAEAYAIRIERYDAVHGPRYEVLSEEDQAFVASSLRQLVSIRRDTIEECAKVAEAEAKDFLSPEYASNQPFGSTCERFACEEVAKAIRALSKSDD